MHVLKLLVECQVLYTVNSVSVISTEGCQVLLEYMWLQMHLAIITP